jgi:hypothetical protein
MSWKRKHDQFPDRSPSRHMFSHQPFRIPGVVPPTRLPYHPYGRGSIAYQTGQRMCQPQHALLKQRMNSPLPLICNPPPVLNAPVRPLMGVSQPYASQNVNSPVSTGVPHTTQNAPQPLPVFGPQPSTDMNTPMSTNVPHTTQNAPQPPVFEPQSSTLMNTPVSMGVPHTTQNAPQPPVFEPQSSTLMNTPVSMGVPHTTQNASQPPVFGPQSSTHISTPVSTGAPQLPYTDPPVVDTPVQTYVSCRKLKRHSSSAKVCICMQSLYCIVLPCMVIVGNHIL